MIKKIAVITTAMALSFGTCGIHAKVSEAEIAKLSTELTPLGGTKAGNADGSIPAWDGGITQAPAGYKVGDHHPDPFPGDKVLFEISGANYKEYADFLSDGQKKLFETYPETFMMPIYESRRSASAPQFVYDETKKNAAKAELVKGGNGVKNAAIGIPFPIPQSGVEVIWNHILKYRGQTIKRYAGQAAVTASGDYNVIGLEESLIVKYSDKNATPEKLLDENIISKFKQKITSPARLAGTALLVHETMDQVREPRKAWTYNTGQRRVRLAPNVAYDAPGTASDGLRTADDLDMFNGAPDRYNWELKGKKEIYIAYNSYKLHSDSLKYDDILKPGHINGDLARFEKHRVWVVEATLKDEFRHIYKKRTFYVDEDSWQIQLVDLYDSRNELYRVGISYGLNYYDVLNQWSTLDVMHDLNSRRYLAIGLDNEERMYAFDEPLDDRQFTPQALRREGKR
jgi:hypothetical protein